MKKIGISFKDGEEEIYNFLKKQLSPSIFVKQLLKDQMEKEDKPKNTSVDRRNNFDF